MTKLVDYDLASREAYKNTSQPSLVPRLFVSGPPRAWVRGYSPPRASFIVALGGPIIRPHKKTSVCEQLITELLPPDDMDHGVKHQHRIVLLASFYILEREIELVHVHISYSQGAWERVYCNGTVQFP